MFLQRINNLLSMINMNDIGANLSGTLRQLSDTVQLQCALNTGHSSYIDLKLNSK